MKKYLLLASLMAIGLLPVSAQTIVGQVNLNLTLGILSDGSGTPVADGSLLQVIALTNGSTGALPSTSDFLGGSASAQVLWQGAFDSTGTGVAGAMQLSLGNVSIYQDGTVGNYLTAGDPVIVRWYPSLTTSDTTPGTTGFGQAGYSAVDGTILDTAWVLPAANSSTGTPDLLFLTMSAGGSVPDTAGQAVSTTAVPEPATTATALGGIGLLFGWFIRRKRL